MNQYNCLMGEKSLKNFKNLKEEIEKLVKGINEDRDIFKKLNLLNKNYFLNSIVKNEEKIKQNESIEKEYLKLSDDLNPKTKNLLKNKGLDFCIINHAKILEEFDNNYIFYILDIFKNY